MVLALVQVDQIIAPTALVFDEAQIRLVPVVAVHAGGKADALEPTCFLTLTEIPHPKLVADAMDGAIIDDALAVRRTAFAQPHGDAGTPAGCMVAVKMEFHAALERQAVVVEGKEDDLIQVLLRPAVMNVHKGFLCVKRRA